MKTTINGNDFNAMCALVDQVQKAVPSGGSELNVLTVITRPLWAAFCRATDMPECSLPTQWQGLKTMRVFGSETHIVESAELWAASIAKRTTAP